MSICQSSNLPACLHLRWSVALFVDRVMSFERHLTHSLSSIVHSPSLLLDKIARFNLRFVFVNAVSPPLLDTTVCKYRISIRSCRQDV